MMRTAFRSATGLLALALALPAAALAAEHATDPHLRLGPVNVGLSLAVSETYTDNAFATAEDTESDFFTTITPGIRLWTAEEYALRGLTFGVNANTINAGNFSELNRVDWNVYGRLALSIRERLSVEIGDTYTPTHLTPLETTSGELEKFTSNAANVGLKYDFLDLWQARLGYTNTIRDYPDSENRSRVEDLIAAGVYFRILPKTSVFAAYDFNKSVYDDDASTLDNTKQYASVGATWEFSEITKGTVSAGYRAVDYEHASEKGWSTWGAALDVRHELTELVAVSLKGARTIDEGKYEGTRYIVRTGLTAGLTWQILERLAGNVNGGYFLEEFSDVNPGDAVIREDKSVRAGLGLVYSFRSWLGFEFSYDFLDRNANIDHYSAKVNTATVKATARF